MRSAPSSRLRRVIAAAVPVVVVLGPIVASAQRLIVPRTAPMDETYAVRVTGLRPGERATIRATMLDSARRTWMAEAEYSANSRGEIDVQRDSSLGGTYLGVHPMGLVTSMELPDHPASAVYVPAGLDSTSVTYTLLSAGIPLDTATVVRRFLSPDVRVDQLDRSTGLVGTLFRPASHHRQPAVLVLGGSEGANSAADVAAVLASHGFTALSLAYFGVDPLPRELDRIPVEYFARAIGVLAHEPDVDSTAIAVLGTSKGAEAALLLAARDRRIRAVVAYAPSSVAWSCICTAADHSSWTIGGADVPNIPPGRDPSMTSVAGIPLRPIVHYRYRLRDSAAVARAQIPVERIAGPVLLVAGDDDALWPSAEMAQTIRARLATMPGRAGDTLLIYAGAGHRIGKAYLPAGTTRIAGGRLETGGTPFSNATAQGDAWPRVLRFLTTSFGTTLRTPSSSAPRTSPGTADPAATRSPRRP